MPELVVNPGPDVARARTVTLAAAKGGIGKTTLTAHVAYPLAQYGLRVLVIDLDAIAGLSTILDASDDGPGLVEFLDYPDIDQKTCVRSPAAWQPDEGTIFAEGGALIPGGCVHIIPASAGTSESVGRQDPASLRRLKRSLSRDGFVEDNYDIVLVDIPGADSVVVDLALQAARHLVLALLPESQGLRGFSRTLFRALDAAEGGLDFNVIGAVTSRYERNRIEHRDVVHAATQVLSEYLGPETQWIGLPVPSRSAVGNANRARAPLARRGAWRDSITNRTRSMDAVAAYSAIAIAIVRDVIGDDRADEIVTAITNTEMGEYPKELLLSGVGVQHAPREGDRYFEREDDGNDSTDAPTTEEN
ncbi:ParA family protein [Dietzia sp. 179-F 9C3 NHS]|uniref:ParA family protein n=1 Tax=Dietzia sp. 179-F 9C3 NHS TaxID=3374295 RepID=UPI00387A047B